MGCRLSRIARWASILVAISIARGDGLLEGVARGVVEVGVGAAAGVFMCLFLDQIGVGLIEPCMNDRVERVEVSILRLTLMLGKLVAETLVLPNLGRLLSMVRHTPRHPAADSRSFASGCIPRCARQKF